MIVPYDLREDVLKLLHDGHKGTVAMKLEARKYIYWPSLDKEIETITINCNHCFINHKPTGIEPLKWSETSKPWSRIHIDYCGSIKKLYYLVIIDSFSKFIDIHDVKLINTNNTISILKKCFSNFGIPDVLVSDNATCFKSFRFQKFAEKHGIELRMGLLITFKQMG